MKVQEFPSSQLGNELKQQSALQGGIQEMTAPATTSLAGIVKEFGLVDFPFAVSSFAQADALLDGPLGQALMAKLPERGLVALGYWDLGFRNVTNSKRAIHKPEDLEGLKIRVIPNPVFLETFKAFKANPVPMPFVELANEARGYQRQMSRAAASSAVKELQAKGMQYNELTPAEQARMAQIAKPVTDKFAASYDPVIVKLYHDELAKARK